MRGGAEAAPAGRSGVGTLASSSREGCRSETQVGASSLPFPPGAILGDFFPPPALETRGSRESSVKLAVSRGRALAATI